jgi:glycosyltransferase involved in cell wall biosynthesis
MIVTRPPDKEIVSLIITGACSAQDAAPCLESIFNQIYPSLEVAYVDSSEDGAGPRKEIESLSVHGTYIHLPGVSRADARNAGLSATNGQYVAFMNACDSWSPNKIQLQIGLMEAHSDLQLIFCLVNASASQAGKSMLPATDHWRSFFKDGIGLDDPAALYAHMVTEEVIPVASVLARRLALPLDGPFRGEKNPMIEYDFILRMSELARFAVVDEALVTAGPDSAAAPARLGERAIMELEIFDDNIARNPWLLVRDPSSIRKREQALLRAAGFGQDLGGNRAEAKRLLAKAWKKTPWDLKVSAKLLSMLGGKPPDGTKGSAE